MRVADSLGSGIAIHIFGQALFGQMKTIARMQATVLGLKEARIMKRAGFRSRRVHFQVALPFPGFAFVVRDLHRETVAPPFGIVADENPMTVAQ